MFKIELQMIKFG